MAAKEVALIMGANPGLGRSKVLRLVKDGVAVIGTFCSHKKEADAAQADIVGPGERALFLQLDTLARTTPKGHEQNALQ